MKFINMLIAQIKCLLKNISGGRKDLDKKERDKSVITLNDLLTSSGKYNERVVHPDCTDEVKLNGEKLLEKVNALLTELGVTDCTVSSGFRPSDVNSKISNAAKKSLHMTGKAIDLVDNDAELAKLFYNNVPLLKKHGLALEHPGWTVGWVHLQSELPKSGNRVFIPSAAPASRNFP
jgi:uncharacterized protein YcbK (DUF882 family)